PNSDDLWYDLEYYIYHKGYGPTNETLGKFIRELFGESKHLDQQQNKPLPPLEEASTLRLKKLKAQEEQK
ncbi:MAG: Serine/threonine protein kinase, partial [Verrucomicrobiales bacterium]|nr:Serine/threonine protein kinase [Verrucomicrobiales bacterium]